MGSCLIPLEKRVLKEYASLALLACIQRTSNRVRAIKATYGFFSPRIWLIRLLKGKPSQTRSMDVLIKDLVQMIFQQTGFMPKRLEPDTSKPEGVFSRAADLARSRAILEWEPKTSVDEGLKRTIDWYTANYSKEEAKRRLNTYLY